MTRRHIPPETSLKKIERKGVEWRKNVKKKGLGAGRKEGKGSLNSGGDKKFKGDGQ